jgi:predicted CXXCH cytochrome family protein
MIGKHREHGIGNATKILMLLGSLLLPVSVPCAFAGIHPVQLQRNTEDAKCIECHEDKAKGKNVHPPVAMGCQTCHLLRVTIGTTRVNLKTLNVATLCFECHADKQAAENPRQVHAPAAQDCLKCHDAHTSVNEHLLLKPASGGKTENLCLGCHTQGLSVPDKGSRHAALDMGCGTCHVTHKTGSMGKQEFDFHLTKALPELCLGCHDPKDAKLVAAHQGQPIAGADCTRCHDPHDSKSPKLLRAYLHPPFADKSCDTCHQAAKDGKVVLTQSDVRTLCVTCHDDEAKRIDAAKVAHPGAQGDCTQCHNPHAGKYPKFVQPSPVAACESCHADVAEIHKTKKVLHPPVFQQGCSVCHEPHGGGREHLLRADTNQLCLACHGPNAKSAKAAGSNEVTIFNGTVRLPENYLNQVFLLRLDDKGFGHPDDKHPVGGVLDASDPQKVKLITCLSCHTPHGGGKGLLVTGMDTNASLCARCHKALRTGTTPVQASGAASTDTSKRR